MQDCVAHDRARNNSLLTPRVPRSAVMRGRYSFEIEITIGLWKESRVARAAPAL
jgi:hypothetical protein